MTECLFCKIVEGAIPADIVYENANVVCFRDIDPQAPTHVLVIPRRHIASLLDVGPRESELLGSLQLAALEVARTLGLEDRGFRLVANCGDDGGQSVAHIHLHLLGGRALSWPPG